MTNGKLDLFAVLVSNISVNCLPYRFVCVCVCFLFCENLFSTFGYLVIQINRVSITKQFKSLVGRNVQAIVVHELELDSKLTNIQRLKCKWRRQRQ